MVWSMTAQFKTNSKIKWQNKTFWIFFQILGNVSVGFINPWTGEEIPSSISDHDEDSLHGKFKKYF